MTTVADAVGAVAKPDALPLAIRRTDVTFAAVTGTVSRAWSCRGVDCASSVPRSHDGEPLPLPQPKLNDGFPLPAGAAARETVACRAFPPVVQALTVHWVGSPRSLLACARVTLTQRAVTCPVSAAGEVSVGVVVGVFVTVAGDRLMARVGVGVAVGSLDEGAAAIDLVCVGVGVFAGVFADVFVGVVVGVFVGVFAGVVVGVFAAVGVRVGAAVEAFPERDGLAVAEVLGLALLGVVGLIVLGLTVLGVLGLMVLGAALRADAVPPVALVAGAVAFAVVGVLLVGVPLVGVREVGVPVAGAAVTGELVGVGDGAKGWQDVPLAAAAVLASAAVVAEVRVIPDAAVTKTVPAISVTVVGRGCAQRIPILLPTRRL